MGIPSANPIQNVGVEILMVQDFSRTKRLQCATQKPIVAFLVITNNSQNSFHMDKRREKTYSYSVFYEPVLEGGWVASVPALPGCHTQGETLEEAEKNIKEAIELYIESLAAAKEEVPEETKSFQGTVKVFVPLIA